MKYRQNKHNRRSMRLKGYDYSKAGLYFITLNCQNRHPLFGIIKNWEKKKIRGRNKILITPSLHLLLKSLSVLQNIAQIFAYRWLIQNFWLLESKCLPWLGETET